MRNVCFNYLYRDASNYLQRGAVVFSDSTDASLPDAENRFRGAFMTDGNFTAHQLRLPELFLYPGAVPTPDDHCLHEFFGLETTTDQPDDRFNRTFSEFLDEVERVSKQGWLVFDPRDSSSSRRYFRFST